jgi:hypothetical protein
MKAKRVIGFILFGSVALFALTGVVMWLWNFAAVPALGLGIITYWQAMALLVLSKILFTGIRPRGGGHGRHKHWKKWREMSPDDREAFKERWKRRKGPVDSSE